MPNIYFWSVRCMQGLVRCDVIGHAITCQPWVNKAPTTIHRMFFIFQQLKTNLSVLCINLDNKRGVISVNNEWEPGFYTRRAPLWRWPRCILEHTRDKGGLYWFGENNTLYDTFMRIHVRNVFRCPGNFNCSCLSLSIQWWCPAFRRRTKTHSSSQRCLKCPTYCWHWTKRLTLPEFDGRTSIRFVLAIACYDVMIDCMIECSNRLNWMWVWWKWVLQPRLDEHVFDNRLINKWM